MKKCIAGISAAAVIAVAGCGSGPDTSREDAHDTRDVDKASPHVIAFNNHYPNVETKCDHGNRLYVQTHDSAVGRNVIIVPNDPSCPGSTPPASARSDSQ